MKYAADVGGAHTEGAVGRWEESIELFLNFFLAMSAEITLLVGFDYSKLYTGAKIGDFAGPNLPRDC